MQGYGEQSAEEKQRRLMLFKSMSFNGVSGADLYNSPSFVVGNSSLYSSELRGEFGAGLLDLHSIDDTELISEHFASESYEPPSFVSTSSLDDEFDTVAGKLQKTLLDGSGRFPTLSKEHGGKEASISKIKVVVRKRPLNKKEKSRGEDDVVTVDDGTLLTVHEPKLKVDLTAYVEKHEFCFDSVLDEDVTNDKVYQVTVEPIISCLFHGTKATCFAYGQTGPPT
ncbi:kinesin-like protein KIN-13A [Wolffia australiana]